MIFFGHAGGGLEQVTVRPRVGPITQGKGRRSILTLGNNAAGSTSQVNERKKSDKRPRGGNPVDMSREKRCPQHCDVSLGDFQKERALKTSTYVGVLCIRRPHACVPANAEFGPDHLGARVSGERGNRFIKNHKEGKPLRSS